VKAAPTPAVLRERAERLRGIVYAIVDERTEEGQFLLSLADDLDGRAAVAAAAVPDDDLVAVAAWLDRQAAGLGAKLVHVGDLGVVGRERAALTAAAAVLRTRPALHAAAVELLGFYDDAWDSVTGNAPAGRRARWVAAIEGT
jgi:hypothetical protein